MKDRADVKIREGDGKGKKGGGGMDRWGFRISKKKSDAVSFCFRAADGERRSELQSKDSAVVQ